MVIGVPKEIKNLEARVGLTPAGVRTLVQRGHRVVVEAGAGVNSALPDAQYQEAGATILASAADVWGTAEMVVKVKEPVESEYGYFRPGLILFTYLHLAPIEGLTNALLDSKVTGIAYETVRDARGTLPLLTPMSEVAGRMSVQVGAEYLQKTKGGRGLLLGGVPGVPPGNTLILGGGIVGINAAKMAIGLGANVTIVDLDLNRLRYLDDVFQGRVQTLASNSYNIARASAAADLVVGGVLIPGASAPRLLTAEMVKEMKDGAVVVDVAIDQGGSFETSRPTTHTDPTYVVDGVIHYCVTNMPAAVPSTSTWALTNATLPYVLQLAEHQMKALQADHGLASGLNTHDGVLTCEAVAVSQNREWVSPSKILA